MNLMTVLGGRIRVEDDVWIGVGSVSLDSDQEGLRDWSPVAGQSELEPYGIHAGNPLVKIGERA